MFYVAGGAIVRDGETIPFIVGTSNNRKYLFHFVPVSVTDLFGNKNILPVTHWDAKAHLCEYHAHLYELNEDFTRAKLVYKSWRAYMIEAVPEIIISDEDRESLLSQKDDFDEKERNQIIQRGR